MSFKTIRRFTVLFPGAICLTAMISFAGCGGGGAAQSEVSVNSIDGATDVAVDSAFRYTFLKAVNTLSVTATSYFIVPATQAAGDIVKGTSDTTVCDPADALAATVSCPSPLQCDMVLAADLENDTRYTICLTAGDPFGGIHYFSGDLFEGFSATFQTSTAPIISAVLPSDGSANVAVDTTVQAVFSKDMDESQINSSTFALKSGDTTVDGTVSYDAATKTATFTPSSILLLWTSYTATINGSVADTAGNKMGDDFSWSFQTSDIAVSLKLIRLDSTELELTSRPIPLRVWVQTHFSEAMDQSATGGATTIEKDGGGSASGTFEWNSDGTVMTFKPSESFLTGTVYHVKISSDAISAKGAAIGPVDETFQTMTKCDVDGDGTPDVVVGANNAPDSVTKHGQAYVFSGATLTRDDLAPANALATITGAADNDMLGGSVACAGDVNADGYEDVIVGASLADGVGTNRGQAYVFSGATLTRNDMAPADALATISGAADNNYLGSSVSGAGDVDKDGYDDVIVGAYRAAGDGADRGQAYIFSGATLITGDKAKATTDALATITGTADGDSFGKPVSGAGDVNNDGYPDIIVGANEAPTYRGKIYVFSGVTLKHDMTPVADALLATITGDENGDNMGSSASDAGDVNNDGYPDIIVGAYKAPAGAGPGQAYVFSGATLTHNDMTPAADALATITGDTNGDWLGYSVSDAGDVNNDGYDDVIVGAPFVPGGGGARRGQAYVFSGAATLKRDMTPADDASATITGATKEDRLGNSVSGAGDVNKDGYPDIIVGANRYLEGAGRGQAYVFSGAATLKRNMTPADDASATITGAAVGDSFGFPVNGASY